MTNYVFANPYTGQEADDEDRQIAQRRQFLYSVAALKAAQAIEVIFVNHSGFLDAMQACDRTFQLSRVLTIPYGVQILGPTGSGKSTVIDYFTKSLPRDTLFEPGFGAIVIRLHLRPTPGGMVSAFLQALKYPFPQVTGHTVYIKRGIVIDAIKQKGTKIAFIDEGHCLASQTRYRGRNGEDTLASDVLREVMDKTGVGLVICANEGFDLDQVDPALASRVSVRLSLKNFEIGPEWSGFVNSFCSVSKAFDLGFLTSDVQIQKLHAATRGNPRNHRRLIMEAVLIAVDRGTTYVDESILCLAFERTQGRASPRVNPYQALKAA